MATIINGLHHITAVSGPPQENFDFYRNKLGLRFTKKTINFDDPFTYHLYYGNYNATPGSSITFFPWTNVSDGKPNVGEATLIQYAVPDNSLDYWKERLKDLNITIKNERDFLGHKTIALNDNDGMNLELVADSGVNEFKTKGEGGVDDNHAIRGFFGTMLSLVDTQRTAELLQEFGWQEAGREDGVIRYQSNPENRLGTAVDLKKDPDLSGRFGRGSIHHVAFRVPDDDAQAEWRDKLIGMGFQVTPVQNRDYFRSIYFREPGGVLFEIATDVPGFTKDEPLESLGEDLKIPSWYKKNREEIERRLPELNVD